MSQIGREKGIPTAVGADEAIIEIPIGKKPCAPTVGRKGDGTFEGEFTVLGFTATA